MEEIIFNDVLLIFLLDLNCIIFTLLRNRTLRQIASPSVEREKSRIRSE